MTYSVIFDVGNVLFRYDPPAIIDHLLPGTPYKDLFLTELFYQPFWNQLDRGDLTNADVLSKILTKLKKPELMPDFQMVLENFWQYLPRISETHHAFCRLTDARIPVYILSNFQKASFDALLNAQPFLKKAAGMVISSEVRMNKPEPGIYTHLLKTYNLVPEHCFFIDDRTENIEAAKKFGIHGLAYTGSPGQLTQFLAPIIRLGK